MPETGVYNAINYDEMWCRNEDGYNPSSFNNALIISPVD